MEFFRQATRIDFMGRRRIAALVSTILVVIALLSLAVRGLEFAVDFTGGTLLELEFAETADLSRIRETLSAAGFDGASVQHLGTAHDVLVRIGTDAAEGAARASEISNHVIELLRDSAGTGVEVRQVEYVGPQVGAELAEKGVLAVLAALGGILVYVAFRYEWRFAVGSVVALAHDVIITVGCFSLFGIRFDLNVLAAVLAVTGYSLNDTIVVFDRVRENFRRLRNQSPEAVMNAAINQTLSRTLMTGLTTLLVLVALIVFGGQALFGFSLALIIGVVVGTWSSIYIAATAALALGVSSRDLVPRDAEGDSREGRGEP